MSIRGATISKVIKVRQWKTTLEDSKQLSVTSMCGVRGGDRGNCCSFRQWSGQISSIFQENYHIHLLLHR